MICISSLFAIFLFFFVNIVLVGGAVRVEGGWIDG